MASKINNAKRLKALMENYYEARKEGSKYGYEIRLVEPDNYEHYYILIKPLAGVYKGQKYIMEMKTKYGRGEDQTTYPTNAPYVHFITDIFHVNISANGGSICLDILKEKDKWSPLNSFDTIVQNILLLFNEPNNGSPYNGEASRVWVECEKEYKLCLDKKSSVKQIEDLYMETFVPFINQAVDTMKKNNYKHYGEWFAELDPNHPEYVERVAKEEEEFKELEDTILSMKKKKVKVISTDTDNSNPTTVTNTVIADTTISDNTNPIPISNTNPLQTTDNKKLDTKPAAKKKNRWAKYQKN
jgi:hypothetical protein